MELSDTSVYCQCELKDSPGNTVWWLSLIEFFSFSFRKLSSNVPSRT